MFQLHERLIEYATMGVYEGQIPFEQEEVLLHNIQVVARVMAELSEMAPSQSWQNSWEKWYQVTENPKAYREKVIELAQANIRGECWKHIL